jgi:hypothetical protein
MSVIQSVREHLQILETKLQECQTAFDECDKQVVTNSVINDKRATQATMWLNVGSYEPGTEEHTLLNRYMIRLQSLTMAREEVHKFRQDIMGALETPVVNAALSHGTDSLDTIAGVLRAHAMRTDGGFYVPNSPFVFGPSTCPVSVHVTEFDQLCRLFFDCPSLTPELGMKHLTALVGKTVADSVIPKLPKQVADKIQKVISASNIPLMCHAHCVAALSKAIERKQDTEDSDVPTCRVDISSVVDTQLVNEDVLRGYLNVMAKLHGRNPDDLLHTDGRCKKRKLELEASIMDASQLQAVKQVIVDVLTSKPSVAEQRTMKELFATTDPLNRYMVTSRMGIDEGRYADVWKTVYSMHDVETEDDRALEGLLDNVPLPKMPSVVNMLVNSDSELKEVLKFVRKKDLDDEQAAQDRVDDFLTDDE